MEPASGSGDADRVPAFESNTKTLRRTMLEGVARKSPDQVVVMVTAARSRGKSWGTIRTWFGPRASCPPRLLPILDRVSLLAAIERS